MGTHKDEFASSSHWFEEAVIEGGRGRAWYVQSVVSSDAHGRGTRA